MRQMSSLARPSDSETDDFITEYVADYSILVSEFAESTILTIAHRLRTVIDYDRVSVLTILKPHMAENQYKYAGDVT
jgi:ABC-type transport system involved in Fe-S cluster assembly fused permease/ATPase subunit